MTDPTPHDPFDDLAEPVVPLAPRAAFAAELRARVAAAVGDQATDPARDRSEEDPMTTDTTTDTTTARTGPGHVPERFGSLVPYLSCTPADEAIRWYTDVLGAEVVMEPILMDDGKVGHSELRFGDTVVMLADEYAPEGVLNPTRLGGNSVSLMLYVPDSAATFAAAVEAGAEVVRPLGEAHGDRVGIVRDPFGHRWFLATHLAP